MNSGAPFTSSTSKLPSGLGIRSTPARSAPAAAAAATASSHSAAAAHGAPRRAESDVCPPLARRSHPAHGADDAPACDEDAQVIANGRDELLDQRSLPAKPAVPPQPSEQRAEGLRVVAPRDCSPRLPNRGLTTTGKRRRETSRRLEAALRYAVSGWGSPARPSRSAVTSLSWQARIASGPFRTVIPRAAAPAAWRPPARRRPATASRRGRRGRGLPARPAAPLPGA